MRPRLLFFSDFICPWCFLAEKGTLAPMRAKYDVEFDWRGFELHPQIPAGGIDLVRMFPPDRIAAMHGHLRTVADGLGVSITPREHAPSTKPALAIADYARERGALDAFREAAMDAHWTEGRDLEDRAVLRDLAEEAGLDGEDAVAWLDDPRVPTLLSERRADAHQWGVTGIPTWFLLPAGWTPEQGMPEEGPRPVKVVGCQPLEVVERAFQMAGAVPLSD